MVEHPNNTLILKEKILFVENVKEHRSELFVLFELGVGGGVNMV